MRLEELRKQIDEIDAQILELLNRRASIVMDVGRAKAEQRLDAHAPRREEEICARLTASNPGPFPTSAVKPVFREIISACLSLEHPLRIAYLGPKVTFTHLACLKRFGLSAQYLPAKTIGEVFLEVEKGNADYGVIPVENSTEGVVSHTLDMFVDSELKICGEILLEISHSLLAKQDGLADIQKVYSHPHAIAQSRKWLEAHLPHAPLCEVTSTAAAAELAAEEPGAAAVASELAAELYDLRVLRRRIEDNPSNLTRFLVIGGRMTEPSGQDKTSILVGIRDRVGALYRMLEPFAKQNLNLTKIESRPSRKRVWEYVFYIDFEGNVRDPAVQATLEVLREECLFVKVLGSYPNAASA